MTQRINLYNKALLPRRDWLMLDYVVAYALVAAALGLLVGWLALTGARRAEQVHASAQQQLEQAQKQLTTLATIPKRTVDAKLLQTVQAAREEQQQLQQILNLGGSQRDAAPIRFSAVLAALAQHTPANVWLIAAQADARGVDIDGYALHPRLVAGLAQALSQSPAMGGKRFASLDVQSEKVALAAPTPALPVATPTPIPIQTPAAASQPPADLPAYRFKLSSHGVQP